MERYIKGFWKEAEKIGLIFQALDGVAGSF